MVSQRARNSAFAATDDNKAQRASEPRGKLQRSNTYLACLRTMSVDAVTSKKYPVAVRGMVAHSLANMIDRMPVTILVVHGIRCEDAPSSIKDIGNGRCLVLGSLRIIVLRKLHIESNETMFPGDDETVPKV